ncbi:MAG: hypothetical protein GXY36_11160 [Chloroflexi bacterium]|nr:hypothetical protein [Chloroflexota bacterium]
MFSLNQFAAPRKGSALLARERLLGERHLRRQHLPFDIEPFTPVSPITETFPAGKIIHSAYGSLSAAEQKERAVQIARLFRSYTLSGVNYLHDEQLAVAVIVPSRSARYATESPQQICVDADGNVAVLHYNLLLQGAPRLVLHRVLLVAVTTLSVLGAAVAAVLG